MTDKTLIGVSIAGSLVAVGVSAFALLRTVDGDKAPPDDQPVTMAGGSLKMGSTMPWEFQKNKNAYRNTTKLAVEKVEWWCDFDEPGKTYESKHVAGQAINIDIEYGKHTVHFYTEKDGTDLRVQVLKPNGNPHLPLLRMFIEGNEHPMKRYATAVSSKGLDPKIECTPKNGEFLVTIRPCKGNGCD